eukprot:3337594-Rhodomonas_salina.1
MHHTRTPQAQHTPGPLAETRALYAVVSGTDEAYRTLPALSGTDAEDTLRPRQLLGKSPEFSTCVV